MGKSKLLTLIGSVCLILVLAVLPFMGACAPAAPPAPPAKTVSIGHLLPMTGALGKWGISGKVVCEIVEEEINGPNNEKGIMVAGERYLINNVFYDTQASPEEAVSGLKRFATLMDIHCVAGPLTTPMAMACLPYLEELKVVMAAAAYGPVTAQGNPLILDTLEMPLAHVHALADSSWNYGLRSIAIIYDKSESYVTWFDDFSKKWKELGGEITDDEKVDTTATTDFYPVLSKLVAGNPDGIFIAACSEPLGLIIKQVREVGYKGTLLASSEVFPTTIEIAGAENAEGLLFSGTNQAAAGLEIPPTAKLRDFVAKYYQKSKGLPWAGDEIRTRDTIVLFALAMEKAGTTTDPYKIREAMMQVAREKGAEVTLMPITGFTEGGSAYGIAFNLFTVHNGKIEVLPGYSTTLTPEVAKIGRGEK